MADVRSYRQFCALARALDVVGERWTLLIIRELFARDCRYSDLREALPGIATNLLAERLRELRAHGVIEAHDAPTPVRATVYRLTPRGRDLGPALAGLVAWGAPLLKRQDGDEFRMRWMALGLPALFQDVPVADLAPLEVLIRAGDEEATLAVDRDGVTMRVGTCGSTDTVTVEADPDVVVALLVGGADFEETPARVQGSRESVDKLRLLAARGHRARYGD
jgi:DNA-binding HxlR family transcriptional regulator